MQTLPYRSPVGELRLGFRLWNPESEIVQVVNTIYGRSDKSTK